MNDLSKEMKAFQAGIKAALPPKPQPEDKTSSLFKTGIRPLVDDYLLEESKKLRDYGSYWSASSAGYCMRKNIFERLGVPHVIKEDDARKQRVFTAGHLFHEWMQKITKEAGLSIAQELELQDEELMIRGHIDDLVLVRKPIEIGNQVLVKGKVSREKVNEAIIKAQQYLILYDYKTRNSRNFDYSKTLSYYHKMQLGTYMYMLRNKRDGIAWNDPVEGKKITWGLSKDLTEARILNIEKDTLRMSESQLLWSLELEKEITGYWTTLNKYWSEKKIPKCTCADQENGFLAKEKWNPYFRDGEPCSIKVYEEFKKSKEKQGAN